MDNDDLPVGRILSRRELLALFGAAGAALLVGCGPGDSGSAQATGTSMVGSTKSSTQTATSVATAAASPVAATGTTGTAVAGSATLPACVVSPELTEGPYFVDEMLNRSDIRADPADGTVKDGAVLTLTFHVSQVGANGCTSLAGAMVDIWHCDALGVYSDVRDAGFNTVGKKFLRGYQLTDAGGTAQFTTIYPGWYQGRAVHIHFKVRGGAGPSQSYEFTSQLFFNETITDQVHAGQPYAGKGRRTLLNDGDSIYRQGGAPLLLTPAPAATGNAYTASFDIGVQLG